MSRLIIAVFITSLVSVGAATGWYYNQQSEFKSAQNSLRRAKQSQRGAFQFNAFSNIERIKELLVLLAELDITDIWITEVKYDGGNVSISYRARNAEAVTEYLEAFYDKVRTVPFAVAEVSANEKGKKSSRVSKKRVAKVPFVIAYIQKKLQRTRDALKAEIKEEAVEQDYNFELSVKLEEER